LASSPYAAPFQRLIDELSRLPGVGPKSAQRIAYYLLDAPIETSEKLATAISGAKEDTGSCSICFYMADQDTCDICRDTRRDESLLCVVEEPRDVVAIERTQGFQGRYHVLGGAITPAANIGPDDLNVKELKERVKNGEFKEVVVATNATFEGETTAIYLADALRPLGVSVTRLAHGIPVGLEIEYADEVTLGRALEGRREL